MAIRMDTLFHVTDFNIIKFLSYTYQGKLRTATLLLYLACLKAFPEWDRDDLYNTCYAKTILIHKTVF